jgi:hypothetical protein
VEPLLAANTRVLALDPFYFGEAKIAQRDFLYALLIAAVGDRPLGIQATQIAAVARWAQHEFGGEPVAVHSSGPRCSAFALIAAALETGAIRKAHLTDPLSSFRQVIDTNTPISQKPELFCFGLLESFDIPQIKELAGASRVE